MTPYLCKRCTNKCSIKSQRLHRYNNNYIDGGYWCDYFQIKTKKNNGTK